MNKKLYITLSIGCLALPLHASDLTTSTATDQANAVQKAQTMAGAAPAQTAASTPEAAVSQSTATTPAAEAAGATAPMVSQAPAKETTKEVSAPAETPKTETAEAMPKKTLGQMFSDWWNGFKSMFSSKGY